MAATAGPDLASHGYVEAELCATGDDYATRVVVRRPGDGGSGTLVVEWLNVSSGQDAAPDWSAGATPGPASRPNGSGSRAVRPGWTPGSRCTG
jgi:hypothetical protein